MSDDKQPPDPAPDAPDERPVDDDPDRSVRQRLEKMIPDLVRRTVTAGLGAAFATEGGIRKLAGELSLPKELAQSLLASADSTKDRVVEIIAREVREFLENLNLNDVLVKTLTQLSFEIRTEVRFIPNDQAPGGVKPEIKRKVAVKRNRGDDGGGSGGAPGGAADGSGGEPPAAT